MCIHVITMCFVMGNPFKKPKAPPMPQMPEPKPVAPKAELVTATDDTSGVSNFEAELRKRQKQRQTTFAGETGGYGGSTKLG